MIVFDRASLRSHDVDGRLHVEPHNICRAGVDNYYGCEIPNWQSLGLKGTQVYRMLRDPEELARAAPTFNNLPILSSHAPVTAMDHKPEKVIGSTGTDAAFEGGFLRNSTVIWAKPEIDAIASDEKRHWSPGYRYRADMTPGEYLGLPYDGVMRDITGNHVALVRAGRQGPSIVVADSKGVDMKRAALLTTAGKILALIAPAMAADAEAVTPEEIADLIAADADTFADDPTLALDEAAITANATKAVTDKMNALREAERAVRPLVGEVSLAMDSAEDVYRFALEHVGYDLEGVEPSAFKGMTAMHVKNMAATAKPSGFAMDRANHSKAFTERFPDAARLVQ